MNQDHITVPEQPLDKKPIASVKYLLWGLVGFIAILMVIQAGRNAPDPALAQKKEKPPPVDSQKVNSFNKNQANEAERIKAEALALNAQTEDLRRKLAAYDSPGAEAAGVPPTTVAQQRAMAGGVGHRPTYQQETTAPAEKTPRQKAAEEREAIAKASRESTTLAVDFSDQLAKAQPAVAQIETTAPQEEAPAVSEPSHVAEAPAVRLFKVLEGTVLECVLTNRLVGTFTGPVNVMLTTPVYSHDHGTLLLPQGTRILGTVSGVRGQSDERLFVAFHRAILPTGFSVNLDQYIGLAQQGQAGLRDKVDHHYLQIFGASVALAAIEGLGQAGGNVGTGSATVRIQGGIGSGSANGSTRIIDQMLQRLPTFRVRERARVKIYISKDLGVPAYDPDFKLDPI